MARHYYRDRGRATSFGRWVLTACLMWRVRFFILRLIHSAELPAFDGPLDMAKTMVTNYRQFQAELAKENLKITALKVNPRHALGVAARGWHSR